MAAITIQDNGQKIKITFGTVVRNIIKAQIKEISIIKTNIIKIDNGRGALNNVFITYADVTSPSTANIAALRDLILGYLEPPGGSGSGATEAKQDTIITALGTLQTAISNILTLVTSVDNKVWFQPLMVDDGGAGVVYKGYAAVGTAQETPQWAVERIMKVGDVDVHTWADGNKNFDNVWMDREALTYS
jgi:hypothetical protein